MGNVCRDSCEATSAANKATTTQALHCTSNGNDPYNPKLGGCCDTKCEEDRPRNDPYYCDESDPNHGKSCWTHMAVCRDSCEASAESVSESSGGDAARDQAEMSP